MGVFGLRTADFGLPGCSGTVRPPAPRGRSVAAAEPVASTSRHSVETQRRGITLKPIVGSWNVLTLKPIVGDLQSPTVPAVAFTQRRQRLAMGGRVIFMPRCVFIERITTEIYRVAHK